MKQLKFKSLAQSVLKEVFDYATNKDRKSNFKQLMIQTLLNAKIQEQSWTKLDSREVEVFTAGVCTLLLDAEARKLT